MVRQSSSLKQFGMNDDEAIVLLYLSLLQGSQVSNNNNMRAQVEQCLSDYDLLE
jgi:hypothetical protein